MGDPYFLPTVEMLVNHHIYGTVDGFFVLIWISHYEENLSLAFGMPELWTQEMGSLERSFNYLTCLTYETESLRIGQPAFPPRSGILTLAVHTFVQME